MYLPCLPLPFLHTAVLGPGLHEACPGSPTYQEFGVPSL